MYLTFLPHVCRALVPEIRVRPEMFCVFQYIDVLTCVILLAVKIIHKASRQVSECADTWYKWIQPTETVER